MSGFRFWPITTFRRSAEFGRNWRYSGHRGALAPEGSVAFDPERPNGGRFAVMQNTAARHRVIRVAATQPDFPEMTDMAEQFTAACSPVPWHIGSAVPVLF
jgi:hypothetical protein